LNINETIRGFGNQQPAQLLRRMKRFSGAAPSKLGQCAA
jgi:hypothetical protein